VLLKELHIRGNVARNGNRKRPGVQFKRDSLENRKMQKKRPESGGPIEKKPDKPVEGELQRGNRKAKSVLL